MDITSPAAQDVARRLGEALAAHQQAMHQLDLLCASMLRVRDPQERARVRSAIITAARREQRRLAHADAVMVEWDALRDRDGARSDDSDYCLRVLDDGTLA